MKLILIKMHKRCVNVCGDKYQKLLNRKVCTYECSTPFLIYIFTPSASDFTSPVSRPPMGVEL